MALRVLNHRAPSLRDLAKRGFALTAGALLAATGLELFLVPNNVMDGGIIGISIIMAHLTSWPLGLLVLVLNLPFLYFGYKQIGRTFVLSTFYAVTALAAFVTLLHPVRAVTGDLLLVTVFGGIVLGVGVGTILRFGGSLDGTEMVAVVLDRRIPFSVGEIIMFFNIFILGSGGFVFGWDRAMYSLIAYFIAYRTIDVVLEGLDEARAVMIISQAPQEISEAVRARLGRGVTHLYGKGGHSQDDIEVLYTVVSRIEFSKLRTIVERIDPDAFITVEQVHDVMGGRLRKKPIH